MNEKNHVVAAAVGHISCTCNAKCEQGLHIGQSLRQPKSMLVGQWISLHE